jgi:hypothetical protein
LGLWSCCLLENTQADLFPVGFRKPPRRPCFGGAFLFSGCSAALWLPGSKRKFPIKRCGRRSHLSWEYSFPVAASFSRNPDRQAHHEAQVFCERSRLRLAGLLRVLLVASYASKGILGLVAPAIVGGLGPGLPCSGRPRNKALTLRSIPGTVWVSHELGRCGEVDAG